MLIYLSIYLSLLEISKRNYLLKYLPLIKLYTEFDFV